MLLLWNVSWLGLCTESKHIVVKLQTTQKVRKQDDVLVMNFCQQVNDFKYFLVG